MKLLGRLHERDLRRRFCPQGFWLSRDPMLQQAADLLSEVTVAEFQAERLELPGVRAAVAVGMIKLLKQLPFVVDFAQRARVFHRLISDDRAQHQTFDGSAAITITIHRNRLYQDAFDKLTEMRANLRRRLRITMINELGLDEAGIDGGGLSREFLHDVLRLGFNPNAGFFSSTADQSLFPK